MTTINSSTLKNKLSLLSIFLLLITLSSCDEKDEKIDQKFTVTFSTGEGSAIPSQSITSGSKATEPSPAPTRSDYVFGGWYTSAGDRFDFNTLIKADITLSAKWTPITNTVTITYLNITGAVNTPLTAVAPTKSPAAATGMFSVKSGSTLPDGLSLDPSTGAISGTPTAVVTTNVTIEFVGTGNYTGTVEAPVTITVNANRTAVESITYPNVTVVLNVALTTPVPPMKNPAEATGMFNVKSGSTLPDGLSLDPTTGAISGTPAATAVTTNVTIEFVGTGSYTGTVEAVVMITVNANRTAVESITYPKITASVNEPRTPVVPVKDPAEATGEFQVKSGSALPDGLSLDPTTGAISGTLTAAVNINVTIEFVGTGNYTGTVENVVNIEGKIRVKSITYPDILVAVNTALAPVAPTTDPAEVVGFFGIEPGTQQLPDGLTIDVSTGAISGMSTTTSIVDVTVQFIGSGIYSGSILETTVNIAITDTGSPTTVNLVTYPPIIAVVDNPLDPVVPTINPTAATGDFSVREDGTPLPTGLNLDPTTGAISGTPTVSAGTVSVDVDFTGNGDYTGSVGTAVSIIVPYSVGTISYPTDGYARVNMDFSLTPTRTTPDATGMFRVKEGSTPLPAGLNLDPTTGAISGQAQPIAVGADVNVVIEFVGDGEYVSNTAETTVTIRLQRSINNFTYASSTVTATVGTLFTSSTPTIDPAEATGTISLLSNPNNVLPAGLNLDPTTGVISGTPTTPMSSRPVVVQFEGNGDFYGISNATLNIEVVAAPER